MDAVVAHRFIRSKGAQLIGPNCPGLISPDESMVGIMPGNIFKKGHTGVISRSGTLTYEVVDNLTKAGLGQSTAVGVGGDPVVGLYFEDLLQRFQDDPDTDSIVLIGEQCSLTGGQRLPASRWGMPVPSSPAGRARPRRRFRPSRR